MNIRSITRVLPLLLFACATAQAQPPGASAPPLPRLVPVTSNVYVIENANPTIGELIAYGGNVTVILTDAGVILVDTKVSQMHDHIVEQVNSLTDLPVTHVILTHNHNDHAGGLARMQQTGAMTIVSEALSARLGELGDPGRPLETYSGERLLSSGGTELHLYEIPGHTAGDTIVDVPQARVLIAGDLVTTADAIPVIVNYDDGGSWNALGAALDRIAEFDFDYLIGGHGPVVSKARFLEFRKQVVGIMETTARLARQGASRETVAETLLAEFGWGGGLATGNIPIMMQELQ